MKINVDQQLKTLADKVMEDEQKQPLTLKWACTQALCGHYPKEDVDGVEKMRRYVLAYRIEKGGWIELNADEVSKLKTLIANMMTPLVVGQCHLMLERKKLDDAGSEVDDPSQIQPAVVEK